MYAAGVSKQWKPSKPTVELAPGAARPSKIRREPPAPVEHKSVRPYPSEREVWTVVIGVVLFALAIAIITIGFSDITSK